ncbi:MAG: hypothetical protein WCJ64_07620 [Rhodospirillaceae bacterium]
MALQPLTLRVADEHRDLIRDIGRRLRLDPQIAQALRAVFAAGAAGPGPQVLGRLEALEKRVGELEGFAGVRERGDGSRTGEAVAGSNGDDHDGLGCDRNGSGK